MTHRLEKFFRLSGLRQCERSRLLLTISALALALCACKTAKVDNSGPVAGSGGDCPTIAGVWIVTTHCVQSPGAEVEIEQEGCNVSTVGASAGFTGFVQADGSFIFRGEANGEPVECSGVATLTSITETCGADCVVTLKR